MRMVFPVIVYNVTERSAIILRKTLPQATDDGFELDVLSTANRKEVI